MAETHKICVWAKLASFPNFIRIASLGNATSINKLVNISTLTVMIALKIQAIITVFPIKYCAIDITVIQYSINAWMPILFNIVEFFSNRRQIRLNDVKDNKIMLTARNIILALFPFDKYCLGLWNVKFFSSNTIAII